jgi:hypothetical protein
MITAVIALPRHWAGTGDAAGEHAAALVILGTGPWTFRSPMWENGPFF